MGKQLAHRSHNWLRDSMALKPRWSDAIACVLTTVPSCHLDSPFLPCPVLFLGTWLKVPNLWDMDYEVMTPSWFSAHTTAPPPKACSHSWSQMCPGKSRINPHLHKPLPGLSPPLLRPESSCSFHASHGSHGPASGPLHLGGEGDRLRGQVRGLSFKSWVWKGESSSQEPVEGTHAPGKLKCWGSNSWGRQ